MAILKQNYKWIIDCLSLPVVPLLMYKSCVTVPLIQYQCFYVLSDSCLSCIQPLALMQSLSQLIVIYLQFWQCHCCSSTCPAQGSLNTPASAHCSYLSIFLITVWGLRGGINLSKKQKLNHSHNFSSKSVWSQWIVKWLWPDLVSQS